MIKPQAPCYQCAERELNCHSQCDKYNEFKENLDIYKFNANQEREDYYDSVVYNTVKRNRLARYRRTK